MPVDRGPVSAVRDGPSTVRARCSAELDRLLDEGIESARKGLLVAIDEAFDRLEQGLRRRLELGKTRDQDGKGDG